MIRTMLAVGVMTLAGALSCAALPPAFEPWAPAFALGGPQVAVVTIADLVRLANAVNSRRQLDAPTRSLVDTVADNLDTIDLGSLHALLPAHRFLVFGRLAPSGAFELRSSATPRFGRFGDAYLELGLKDRGASVFTVRTEMRAHVRLHKDEMFAMASRSFDWLRGAASKVAPLQPRGLDLSDRNVLDRLRLAFPESIAFIERYAEIRDLVSPGPRMRVHVRLNKEALHADFPELAPTFELARRVYRARGRFIDERGKTIGVARLDTEKLDIVIAFVPDMRLLTLDRYHALVDVEALVAGVKVGVRGIRATSAVQRADRGTSIVSRVRTKPEIQVSGAALVDALIPSDLASILSATFDAVVGSDGGRGAHWSMTFPVRRTDPVRIKSDVDLPSNGIVTFGLRVLRRLEVGTDTLAGLERLTTRGLAAFSRDFERFQGALEASSKTERSRPAQ